MRSRNFTEAFAATACLIAALAGPRSACAEPESVRIILVGDSTMAMRNGYGDAFCRLFQPDVACINVARNGRSSRSYRADGSWELVKALLRTREAHRTTYVLVQFGHNDQPGKPGRSTDLETEFPANMTGIVDELQGAGAVVVLVTPLTRRSFKDGVLVNDLAPWADATRRVAQSRHVALLDLNADSSAAVARMGSAQADTLALQSQFDHTHLGAKGASFFASMVADELVRAVPALSVHFGSPASAR
jgi:pectinesterase